MISNSFISNQVEQQKKRRLLNEQTPLLCPYTGTSFFVNTSTPSPYSASPQTAMIPMPQ